MKSLKGTKTEKNLLEAFAGESMARNYNVPIVMDSLVGSIESDMGIKAT